MSKGVAELADKVAGMMAERRRPLTVSVQNIGADKAIALLFELRSRGFKADLAKTIMGTKDDKGGIKSLTAETCIVVRPKARRR